MKITKSPFERLLTKVDLSLQPSSCWVWKGTTTVGYGKFWFQGCMQCTHRVILTILGITIAPHQQVDHLCRNRRCIRPSHLELVTTAENTYRGNGPAGINYRKTHCNYGHKFTTENTYTYLGRRICRQCSITHKANYRLRLRLAAR